ncbi:DUF86 domain-containing protein [Candidatus Saganbacteria bacterium]|nr:DUF86 domain-containing protein [Candidatus Saganbacteria bacterium]
MIREYSDYIRDIANAVDQAQRFTEGLSYDAFREDIKTAFAVVRALEVVGEAAKNVPGFVKEQYPEVPWKEMSGMRDKLIHEYFGVKYEVVWDTVKRELPDLKLKFAKILKEL